MEKTKNQMHAHDHNCENCTCEHDHDHEHEHQTVTLTLEDNTELVCEIIDLFEIDGQEYIALLHPVEETALLYRFEEFEDGEIEIQNIDDHDEYELVSTKFLALQEEYEVGDGDSEEEDFDFEDDDFDYDDDDDDFEDFDDDDYDDDDYEDFDEDEDY